VRHREEEIETDACDDDNYDVKPACTNLDGLEDHVADDAHECGVPRHEAVDETASEGGDDGANQSDESEQTDVQAIMSVSTPSAFNLGRRAPGEEERRAAQKKAERYPEGAEACGG
jgi:hypothetical protein